MDQERAKLSNRSTYQGSGNKDSCQTISFTSKATARIQDKVQTFSQEAWFDKSCLSQSITIQRTSVAADDTNQQSPQALAHVVTAAQL